MRDSFERDASYYQRARQYADEFLPEEQPLGFILLENGKVVFVDAEGVPYDVLVRGDSLLMGNPVRVPEQSYEVISSRQAYNLLNPYRRLEATYRVNNVPTYRPSGFELGRMLLSVVLAVVIIGGVIFAVFNFFPKETKETFAIWQDGVTKIINPVASQAQIALVPSPPVFKENGANAPVVRAPMAVAINAKTGEVLYSKEPSRRAPMASTTKIMTALTAVNIPGVSMDDTYVVVKEDLPQYSDETRMGLKVGETVTFRELLYGMMLPSGNDAARALARYAGAKLPGTGDTYARFVEQMNKQAQAYGLINSRFANPHGLDAPDHYTTAYDLAVLGKLLLDNPTLAEVVSTPRIALGGRTIVNSNYFINRGGNGIKPGYTGSAGLCLVASTARNGQTVVVVILGADRAAYNADPLSLTEFSFKLINGG
jgi:D-alanyl-D-alanine carboxypeptidase